VLWRTPGVPPAPYCQDGHLVKRTECVHTGLWGVDWFAQFQSPTTTSTPHAHTRRPLIWALHVVSCTVLPYRGYVEGATHAPKQQHGHASAPSRREWKRIGIQGLFLVVSLLQLDADESCFTIALASVMMHVLAHGVCAERTRLISKLQRFLWHSHRQLELWRPWWCFATSSRALWMWSRLTVCIVVAFGRRAGGCWRGDRGLD